VTRIHQIGLSVACAFVLVGAALAQQDREHGGGGRAPEARAPEHAQPAEHKAEPHAGPHGYSRVAAPHGWNNRPKAADRGAYQHNFQAARSFKVGPYHRPSGWAVHHWGYGETLPRAYWAPEYVLGDYWLFALEVPPSGYEWVRDDTDALLVDTNTGEILQVEYGVFG
jgi:Ni/Co efflux regulator RcnB